MLLMANQLVIKEWQILVKIQAILSATDAACLILRIDDVLASTKEPPARGAGGMPPGMGGMGGMGGMPGMGMGGMPPGMF